MNITRPSSISKTSLLAPAALAACAALLSPGCAPVDDTDEGGASVDPIVAGSLASRTHSRSTVGIERLNGGRCTGVIVDRRWVLSAAHCGIIVGDRVRLYDGSARTSTRLTIDRVVLPPGVHPSSSDFDALQGQMADLAMLHLTAAVPTSIGGAAFGPAILPSAPVDQHTVAGNAAIAVGTGNHDGTFGAGTQMRARSTSILSVDPSSGGSSGVLWASSDVTDGGDSGGPIYVNTTSGLKVVGILRGSFYRAASAAIRSYYSAVRDSRAFVVNTINGVQTNTLLEVTYENCSGTVRFTNSTAGSTPTLPLGSSAVLNFGVTSSEVRWTCDGTAERTGCEDDTDFVRAYRGEGRRFVVECRNVN